MYIRCISRACLRLLSRSENVQKRVSQGLVGSDSLLRVDACALVEEVCKHGDFSCITLIDTLCLSDLIQNGP